VAKLSAIQIGHLYPAGDIPGTHFCWTLESTLGAWCSQKNQAEKSTNPIENRTRNLLACRAVPESAVPPCIQRMMRWARHIACIREKRYIQGFVEKSEGTGSLGGRSRRWEESIKMDPK